MPLSEEDRQRTEQEERFRSEAGVEADGETKSKNLKNLWICCVLIGVILISVLHLINSLSDSRISKTHSGTRQAGPERLDMSYEPLDALFRVKGSIGSLSELQPERLDMSYEQLDALFGVLGSLTDLQKKAEFLKYQGRRITWTGTVVSVDSNVHDPYGDISVQVRHKKEKNRFLHQDNLTNKQNVDRIMSEGNPDVILSFERKHIDRLLTLNEGAVITYSGILTSYDPIEGHSIDDAEIVENITSQSREPSTQRSSESMATKSREGQWRVVVRWQGNGTKKTEPFTIQGTHWRVLYTTAEDWEAGYFIVRAIKTDDPDGFGEIVAVVGGNAQDTTFIYSRGEFFLDITSSVRWGISVEEFIEGP